MEGAKGWKADSLEDSRNMRRLNNSTAGPCHKQKQRAFGTDVRQASQKEGENPTELTDRSRLWIWKDLSLE